MRKMIRTATDKRNQVVETRHESTGNAPSAATTPPTRLTLQLARLDSTRQGELFLDFQINNNHHRQHQVWLFSVNATCQLSGRRASLPASQPARELHPSPTDFSQSVFCCCCCCCIFYSLIHFSLEIFDFSFFFIFFFFVLDFPFCDVRHVGMRPFRDCRLVVQLERSNVDELTVLYSDVQICRWERWG